MEYCIAFSAFSCVTLIFSALFFVSVGGLIESFKNRDVPWIVALLLATAVTSICLVTFAVMTALTGKECFVNLMGVFL